MSTEIESELKSKKKRTPKPPPEGVCLYRVEEAAYLLRFSITTLWRLVRAGKMPYRQTPAGIRFAKADLDSYVAGASECRGTQADAVQRVAKAKAKGLNVGSKYLTD